MIKNSSKKGLSTVVTILIIILLVFVAIGIVWVVVRNVIESGTGQIEISSKCIKNVVKATSVDCSIPTACNVVLKKDTGSDEIGGIKLVFYEGSLGGDAISVPGNIAPLSTISRTVDATQGGITTPDKIEVTIYFLDESNNERICSTASSLNF